MNLISGNGERTKNICISHTCQELSFKYTGIEIYFSIMYSVYLCRRQSNAILVIRLNNHGERKKYIIYKKNLKC